jgi:hypothetical protein
MPLVEPAQVFDMRRDLDPQSHKFWSQPLSGSMPEFSIETAERREQTAFLGACTYKRPTASMSASEGIPTSRGRAESVEIDPACVKTRR